jgi:cytochrome b6-f complex subunit 7
LLVLVELVEDYAMGGEIFTTAVLSFVLVLIGLGVGFVMLKVQGGEE